MTPPIPPAMYTFPERALRRWAHENLTWMTRPEGGVEVVFRFEGSTCGNVAFLLLYHVVLSSEATGRRCEALYCEPAPHDDGHRRMCCWQEDAARAAGYLRWESPLLGQPLDAALAWRPTRSPAGCLCTEPSRNHKWQAVLETVHYALCHPPSLHVPT